jgi:four helix bundle protein
MNDEYPMTNDLGVSSGGASMPNCSGRAGFDLAERTSVFAEAIVAFARKLPQSPVNNPLINQLVRSGTSIGANYCEADDAVSKKEFRKNICICRKESRETKYWLRVLASAVPDQKAEARRLWLEAKELHLIFCKIFRSSSE